LPWLLNKHYSTCLFRFCRYIVYTRCPPLRPVLLCPVLEYIQARPGQTYVYVFPIETNKRIIRILRYWIANIAVAQGGAVVHVSLWPSLLHFTTYLACLPKLGTIICQFRSSQTGWHTGRYKKAQKNIITYIPRADIVLVICKLVSNKLYNYNLFSFFFLACPFCARLTVVA
jgi:hypothetical protein